MFSETRDMLFDKSFDCLPRFGPCPVKQCGPRMESSAQSGLEEAGLDGEVSFKKVNRNPHGTPHPKMPMTDRRAHHSASDRGVQGI